MRQNLEGGKSGHVSGKKLPERIWQCHEMPGKQKKRYIIILE